MDKEFLDISRRLVSVERGHEEIGDRLDRMEKSIDERLDGIQKSVETLVSQRDTVKGMWSGAAMTVSALVAIAAAAWHYLSGGK